MPLAAAFEDWERAMLRNRAPVAVPAPHKRYLIFFAVCCVLAVAVCFGLAWIRESAGWRDEVRAQRHGAILLQGTALHGEIETLAQQSARLEEKARILMQYATDLRYSFDGGYGSLQIKQADAVLADRDRLLREIENRRQRLSALGLDVAALNAR